MTGGTDNSSHLVWKYHIVAGHYVLILFHGLIGVRIHDVIHNNHKPSHNTYRIIKELHLRGQALFSSLFVYVSKAGEGKQNKCLYRSFDLLYNYPSKEREREREREKRMQPYLVKQRTGLLIGVRDLSATKGINLVGIYWQVEILWIVQPNNSY